MDYTLCLILTFVSGGYCATIQNKTGESVRSRSLAYSDLIACGMARDLSCFFDKADQFVEAKRMAILAEADREVLKATGRADEDTTPSRLSNTINRIIAELTEMFKDGLLGFFKSAREGEDDDETEDIEDEEEEEKKPIKSVGEGRKKKKKAKLIALIKLIIIGLVIKAKLTLLLKALSAALQIKFFLVALAGLILNAARFYLDLKKGHQPQKVIYYEHAQHQHHYEGGEDEWNSGPGGYWGRSYDEEDASAQDLAYSKQKPLNNNKSTGSWFG